MTWRHVNTYCSSCSLWYKGVQDQGITTLALIPRCISLLLICWGCWSLFSAPGILWPLKTGYWDMYVLDQCPERYLKDICSSWTNPLLHCTEQCCTTLHCTALHITARNSTLLHSIFHSLQWMGSLYKIPIQALYYKQLVNDKWKTALKSYLQSLTSEILFTCELHFLQNRFSIKVLDCTYFMIFFRFQLLNWLNLLYIIIIKIKFICRLLVHFSIDLK